MNRGMIPKILGEYEQICKDKGYNVMYIGLFGSQNYDLDDEQSDIDACAVVYPSVHDVALNLPKAHITIETENGNIYVSDVRDFVDRLSKLDARNVEVLCTNYYICNNNDFMFYRDTIVQTVNSDLKRYVAALSGTYYTTKSGVFKDRPLTHESIKKCGYSEKHYCLLKRLIRQIHGALSIRTPRDLISIAYDKVYFLKIKRGKVHFSIDHIHRELESYDKVIERVNATLSSSVPDIRYKAMLKDKCADILLKLFSEELYAEKFSGNS